MSNSLQNQRTYALIGTSGCGKTSIVEMLLFQAGIINRLGSIEEGTSTLDYEPEEIKRRGSIQAGFANFTWEKHNHCLIDIPGDNNFNADMEYLLKAVDSAVLVIDAIDGVRPQTKKMWAYMQKEKLPTIVFINKMDKELANFDMAFNSLSATLGMKPVVFFMPIIEDKKFVGVVDIFPAKALYFMGDGKVEEREIPDHVKEEAQLLRDVSMENIAGTSEELMEKYLAEGTLSMEEMQTALRKAVINRDIVPVIAGDTHSNKSGIRLLNSINDYMPSPLDRAPFVGIDGSTRKADDEAVSAFVCKTLNDPFAGRINILRIMSGSISSDSVLKNMRTEETERMSSLITLNGKIQNQCKDTLQAGSIVAVAKLKNTKTGDTLCDEKAPFEIEKPELLPRLISYGVSAAVKGEEDKVFAAIQKLTEEDLSLKLSRDEETGDTLISGMGQLHIELAVEKAKRRGKVDIVLSAPKVPYRETVKGKVQVQGRHKKQSGGKGQFGDCFIEMEGLKRGEGYQFEDAIVGGAIPKQYIPAVDKGIQESAKRGFLAGYPVIDFKVKLYDGSYHNVDSSEMAFKLAGSIAFKKAMEELKVILLEPIAYVTISVPDECMGDIIGDLASRRGKVLGSDSDQGITEIKANVPMSEMMQYATDLKSMTAGQGFFIMEFDHYDEAPQPVVDKVVAEYQQQKSEE